SSANAHARHIRHHAGASASCYACAYGTVKRYYNGTGTNIAGTNSWPNFCICANPRQIFESVPMLMSNKKHRTVVKRDNVTFGFCAYVSLGGNERIG
ncbi:1617_t:CDS:2, partial [Gigaspora rosea]